MEKPKKSRPSRDLPDTQSTERLRRLGRLGGAFGVGLSILTSMSPLFGAKGLGSVIPLPASLSNIGRPLITAISLALVLMLGRVVWSNKPTRGKTILGVAMLVVALALLGIYMTWITPRREVVPPSMSPLDRNVVAVFVIGFSIALFAGSLMTLASQWIINPSAAPTATVPDATELIAHEPSQTDPVVNLLRLVVTANWTGIERKSRNLRSFYWRLFGAISRIIVNPRQEARDIRKTRFWVRAIAAVDAFRLGKAKERKLLLAIAEGLLPWLTIRNEVWIEIEKFGASPKDSMAAFQAYLLRFFSAYTISPDVLGYARVIEESDRALSELLAFQRSVPPLEHSKIRSMMLLGAARQRVGAFGESRLEEAEADFQSSTSSAISLGDRVKLAEASYDAARKFLDVRNAYVAATLAWHSASSSASIAYCLAIAADQREDSLRKLEALAYAVDQSAGHLHIDVKQITERMINIRLNIQRRGVKMSAELQEKVETAMRKVDGLPPSLFTNSV